MSVSVPLSLQYRPELHRSFSFSRWWQRVSPCLSSAISKREEKISDSVRQDSKGNYSGGTSSAKKKILFIRTSDSQRIELWQEHVIVSIYFLGINRGESRKGSGICSWRWGINPVALMASINSTRCCFLSWWMKGHHSTDTAPPSQARRMKRLRDSRFAMFHFLRIWIKRFALGGVVTSKRSREVGLASFALFWVPSGICGRGWDCLPQR